MLIIALGALVKNTIISKFASKSSVIIANKKVKNYISKTKFLLIESLIIALEHRLTRQIFDV
jgi:hypothetical protein